MENPIPLQKELQQELNINATQYTLLFSLFTLPNWVLPLFAGYVADKVGRRPMMIVYALIMALGQFTFAFSVAHGSFKATLYGRLLIGVGNEALCIVNLSTISAWCPYKLSFALSTYIASGKLGAIANNLFLPYLYQITSKTSTGFFVGAILIAVTLLCLVLIVLIERWSIARGLFQDNQKTAETDSISLLTALKSFPNLLWGLCALCGLFCACKYSFGIISSALIQIRFGFSLQAAGFLISVPYAMIIVMNPILGTVLDRTGKNGVACIIILMYLDFSVYIVLCPIYVNGLHILFAKLLPMCVLLAIFPHLWGFMQFVPECFLALYSIHCGQGLVYYSIWDLLLYAGCVLDNSPYIYRASCRP